MKKKRPKGLKYKIIKVNKSWFKNQNKKKEGICPICSNVFYFYESERNRKYCSVECYRISQKGKKRIKHSEWMKKAHKEGIVRSYGFKGKNHTLEERKKISLRLKDRWKDKKNYFNSEEYRQLLSDNMVKLNKLGKVNKGITNCKHGYYNINGKNIYFRSSWEPNYALYLDFLIKQKQIKKWEYEVDTFWFEKIRRGVRSYKPDFKIFNNDNTIEYHEVKGWMNPKSKTKIKRMAKYYPEIKLIIIDSKSYKDIKKKLGTLLKFY